MTLKTTLQSGLFAALVGLAGPALAQEISSPGIPPATMQANGLPVAGTIGLSFALPAGGAPTFGGTYFLNPNGALRLDVGLLADFSPGPATFGFSVEAGYRAYLATFGKLRPFVQPGLFISESPSGVTSPGFTFAVDGSVGAEYFILEHFSFGIATGLALNFTAPQGGGAVQISLSTGTTDLFGEILW